MLTKAEQTADIAALMSEMGRKARAAARPLATASAERKHAALIAMEHALRASERAILDANAIDMANGEEAGLSAAFLDRVDDREQQAHQDCDDSDDGQQLNERECSREGERTWGTERIHNEPLTGNYWRSDR